MVLHRPIEITALIGTYTKNRSWSLPPVRQRPKKRSPHEGL